MSACSVVHEWRLYNTRSLCSLLDNYSMCCSSGYGYVLAPEYGPHLRQLPLMPRASPPPAHL